MRKTNGIQDFLKARSQLGLKQELNLVWSLSVPAILAQITSVVMQYIDAAMVGRIGASSAASIGVVASSTWLIYGVGGAIASGFSVQVAQAIGANDQKNAKAIVKESLLAVFAISLIISIIGMFISKNIPLYLGAEESLHEDASVYFFIFSLSLPAVYLATLGLNMLECSGNMKLPSILSATMCFLDVIFNAIFIFPILSLPFNIRIRGLNLGTRGAALGTAGAEVVICIITWVAILFYSPPLKLTKENKWAIKKQHIKMAIHIAFPMSVEQIILCGAQICSTMIITKLGTIALAAHSFAVTAEAFCYMPAYGIATAATTLTGQSIGAKRADLARKFAYLTEGLGIAVMAVAAIAMYIASPFLFSFLTPDESVRELGVQVLRIEVFSEPLFAASIIASGALRGVGDVLFSCILNLSCIWGIRITLSYILTPIYGLRGAWIAMCIELCIRGILFLLRLAVQKWKVL